MSKKSKNKIFSCIKCGNPYEAYPPDDKHRIATMLSEEAKKDHIIVKYICKNCGNINILYWAHDQPDAAFNV